MTVIPPIIDYESEHGNIHCPGCKASMRPVHWHYPDKKPLFTNMYLCTDCGEYVFDKHTQECLTLPKNVKIPKGKSPIEHHKEAHQHQCGSNGLYPGQPCRSFCYMTEMMARGWQSCPHLVEYMTKEDTP